MIGGAKNLYHRTLLTLYGAGLRRSEVAHLNDPGPDPLRAPTDDDHPRLRYLMTAGLTPDCRALVNVVIHASEIVRLKPGWTLPVPCPPAAARQASHSCPHCTSPKPPECAHPDTVEPGS